MSTEARNGYDYSSSTGKFEQTSLSYNAPDNTQAYAFGARMSIYGARILIKNHYDQLVDDIGETAAKNENIAFTFGKESLLSMLAQEDCIGVKFYIGKRTSASCPDNFEGTWEGSTLIAIGIKKDEGEPEIGAETDYIARGIDGTIYPPMGVTQPGIVTEVVPAFTMNDIPSI